jgi:hypothetical protein
MDSSSPLCADLARQYEGFVEGSGGGVTSAWIQPHSTSGSVSVSVRRSHKSIQLNKSRTSISSYRVDLSSGVWEAPSGPVQQDASTLFWSPSPSGRFIAGIRKEPSTDGKASRAVIEVWSSGSGDLLRTIYPEALHGDVIADGEGGLVLIISLHPIELQLDTLHFRTQVGSAMPRGALASDFSRTSQKRRARRLRATLIPRARLLLLHHHPSRRPSTGKQRPRSTAGARSTSTSASPASSS